MSHGVARALKGYAFVTQVAAEWHRAWYDRGRKTGFGALRLRASRYHMIRSLRQASDTQPPLAAVRGESAHDEVRVLREIVTALCERVELLEAHALLVGPALVARAQR